MSKLIGLIIKLTLGVVLSGFIVYESWPTVLSTYQKVSDFIASNNQGDSSVITPEITITSGVISNATTTNTPQPTLDPFSTITPIPTVAPVSLSLNDLSLEDPMYAAWHLDNQGYQNESGKWMGRDYLVAQSRGVELFFLQAGGSIYSAGDLSFNSGTFRSNLTVAGNVILQNALNVENGLTIPHGNITLGEGNIFLDHLTGNIRLMGDLHLVGDRKITGTGTLTIDPTSTLTLQSNLTIDNSGNLIAPSITSSSLTYAGDITITANSATRTTNVTIFNSSTNQVANLTIEGNINVQGGHITLSSGEIIDTATADTVTISSDGNVVVKLGDALGVNEFRIYDSTGVVSVFTVDSDGNIISGGGAQLAQALTIQSGGATISGDVTITGDVQASTGHIGGALTLGTQATTTTQAVRADRSLTLASDSNVTITNSGSAQDLTTNRSWTLGWNGQLPLSRGGTGTDTLASNAVLYGNATSAIQALAVNATATNKFLTQVSSGTPAWNTIQASDLPSSFSGLANPSSSIGLTTVNGSATTAMRSDGAPALDQSIAPTWTSAHLFKNTANSLTALQLQQANGTSVFNVDTTNGRVGIGTTSPASKLAIAGTGSSNGITLGSDQTTPLNLYRHMVVDTPWLRTDGNLFANGDFFVNDRAAVGPEGIDDSARLNVYDDGTSTYAQKIYYSQQGTSSRYGLLMEPEISDSGTTYGVYTRLVTNAESGTQSLYGVFSNALDAGGGVTSTLYAVYGSASGGTTNWAGYFPAGNAYFGGNVGIGTTGSSYKLDVSGGSGIVGQFSGRVIGGNAVGTNEFVTLSQLTGGTGQYWSRSGTNLSPTTAGDDVYLPTNSILGIGYDPTTISGGVMAINGNVGIGTTSPGARLEVVAPTSGIAMKVGRMSGNPSIRGISDTDWLIADAGTSGRLGLNFWSTGDVVLVNGGGNVGIGIITSGSKLQVNGNAAIGYSESTAGPAKGLAISGNVGIGTTSPLARLGVIGADSLNTSFAGNISGATGTGLVITNAGNVGIGTTSPQRTLQVNGSIRMGALITGAGSAVAVYRDVNGDLADSTSSIRYKDNVIAYENILDKVLSLRITKFNWGQNTSTPGMLDFGLIAEEVNNYIPDLVNYEADGITPHGLKYEKTGVFALKAIQEQQEILKQVRDDVTGIQNDVLGIQVKLNDDGSILGMDTSVEPSPNLIERIKQVLEKLGIAIKDGIVSVSNLVTNTFSAEKAQINTIELQKIQLTDQTTSELYCTWIDSGEWIKVKGSCDSITPTLTPSPTPTEIPAITPSPTIEPTIMINPTVSSEAIVTPTETPIPTPTEIPYPLVDPAQEVIPTPQLTITE